MRTLLSRTITPSWPRKGARSGMNLRGRRRGGPSPAECIVPQMRERERRKRYQSHDVTTHAPSKLIGYVSAGGLECPGEGSVKQPRKPRGVVLVWMLAAALLLVWITNRGV